MALVSNIHYNLAAWASGTFILGQRITNAGNAYQCTTPGSSSAAPTGTGTGINNGGVAVFKYLSSVDYTSLQAWANALPATLPQAYVAQIWNNGSITTTSGVGFLTLTGHVTTPANNITITTAPGEAFNSPANPNLSTPLAFSTTNGVNFVCPATGVGGINYFLIQDDQVVISNIQVQDPNPTSGSTILQTTQNAIVNNCIFDGYAQDVNASIINPMLGGASTCVSTFINCLIVDRAPTNVPVISASVQTFVSDYNTNFVNCTFAAINNPPNLGAVVDETQLPSCLYNITNCIFIGYPTAAGGVIYSDSANTTINVQTSLFGTGGTAISGQGVVLLGTGNVYTGTLANTFVNTASNFRVLPTSSTGSGLIDTTDIPTATDIFNNARAASGWTFGAAQLIFPASVWTTAAHAAVAAKSNSGTVAIWKANGAASVAALSGATNYISTWSVSVAASINGVSAGNAIWTAGGQASVIGYSSIAAVNATITLNNPGTQTLNTAFPVTGTYTITPSLQFADDNSATFTPIPSSGVSPLGSTPFSFTHPGDTTAGAQSLVVEDLSSTASAAVNYAVTNVVIPPAPPVTSSQPFAAGASLSALATILPAYIYQQYADDDNIQAFAAAYNIISQSYMNWFNQINLPVYTGALIVGPLLDWVGQGIYGIPRPILALTTVTATIGDFDTYGINSINFNGSGTIGTSAVYNVTDDIYKRILTWSLYKGDGFQFSVLWLKRRVMRFLAGVNGTDYTGPTDQVSVQFSGTQVVNITLTNGTVPRTVAPVLQAAIALGVLPLPFQYTFNVLIN